MTGLHSSKSLIWPLGILTKYRSKVEDTMIHVLKIPTKRRNRLEINELIEGFKKTKYFMSLADEDRDDIIKEWVNEIKHEFFYQGQVLFRKGDTGTKFYIIIKGKLKFLDVLEKHFEFTFGEYLLFLRNHKDDIVKINNKENFKLPEWFDIISQTHCYKTFNKFDCKFYEALQKEVTLIQRSEMRLTGLNMLFSDPKKKIYKIVYHKHLNTFTNGSPFGELALVNSITRTATVVALEDTDWAVLDKIPFNKILKNYEKEKLKRQTCDMKKFIIFKTVFRKDRLKNIIEKMTEINLCKGQTLFKEGDQYNKIYVIKEGEFDIYKNMHISLSTYILNQFLII